MNAHEGTRERVTLTTDDATTAAVEDIATLLHAQGFVVERRTFIHTPAEEPRRVVFLALVRPLPALVPLVAPPTALVPLVAPPTALVPLVAPPTALPGIGPALVAALYPALALGLDDPTPAALATLQLKAEGAFASISARTGPELLDALLVLAGRVRRATWAAWPSADRERRIVYVDGAWYDE